MTAQDFERDWWGDCANTFHEEQKQTVYASRMGLEEIPDAGHPPTYDLGGASVIDVGGGPVSLLLKCVNRGRCHVIDPCEFPPWVWDRYRESGIFCTRTTAESAPWVYAYDEAWCYNVLQHVEDPALIACLMRSNSRVQRIFEWIDIPAYEGHPHELTEAKMRQWFGNGTVAWLNQKGAVGRAFYGVFS